MRTIYVIGIGAGDPDHVTAQAVAAMRQTDVFFTLDKGGATADLARLRGELLGRHTVRSYRLVTVPDPERDRGRHADAAAYERAVADWQGLRARSYAAMIERELGESGTGAFLVWGDPALYDSTLRILDDLRAREGMTFAVRSVPGITSVQALAAAHGIVLHRIGRPFLVTTGRRLADGGMPGDVDDVVVMLDGQEAFAALPDTDLDVYWGACLGTPHEQLVAGDLREVAARISAVRAAVKEKAGWVMDVYLLRRRDATP